MSQINIPSNVKKRETGNEDFDGLTFGQRIRRENAVAVDQISLRHNALHVKLEGICKTAAGWIDHINEDIISLGLRDHPFTTSTRKSGFLTLCPSVHMRPHGLDSRPHIVDVKK